MSTRLRPIVMISDSVVAGGNARIALESTAKVLKVSFPARGSMPEDMRLVRIYDSIPWDQLVGNHWLWLFREPRNTPANRSRYMQLCQHYGIRPYIKKQKYSFEQTLDDAIRLRNAARDQQHQNTAARIAERQRELMRQQQAVPPAPTDWYQPLTVNWMPSPGFQQQMAAQQQGINHQILSSQSAPTFDWTSVNPLEDL